MNKTTFRIPAILLSMLLGAFAAAGTITVTSPTQGDFLGRTNSLRFNTTGSNTQVRVTVRVINIANPNTTFTFQQDFDPDVDRQVENGNIALNFNESTPEGQYRIEVRATEPNNTYNQVNLSPVEIDVLEPKVRDLTPINGAFVRGDVPIRVILEERNVELWRVQVNSQDIPNNTGTTDQINVTWNTAGIIKDGQQNISIRIEDKANNVNTRNLAVTLDRRPPSTTVLSPTTTSRYRPNSTIPVLINFADQFANSILAQNVDVLIQSTTGQTLGRVARVSSTANGATLAWTGRIRTRGLPRTFRLVVTATDRAGNPAVNQQVEVRLR